MDFYHLIVRKLISPEIWVSRQAISEDNQYNQYNSGKVKSGLVFNHQDRMDEDWSGRWVKKRLVKTK